jgi:hypothetical protein
MRQIDKIKLAVKENNDALLKEVEKIQWQKYDTIARNAVLEASKVATAVKKITDGARDYSTNTLKLIRNVTVPDYMF